MHFLMRGCAEGGAVAALTERPGEAENDNAYCHRANAGQGMLRQALACVLCALFHARGWW
jgi:hypothetical protein